MLLLAVDANFKLKNRMRPNKIDDPPLGPGWSYWVEQLRYKRHLKKYVAEKDLSTCIAFAALLQKDTRLTTGLRVSGVGGCVCARHECVRPNGMGDLQKGERYANMDFIVFSALAGFSLMLLTISYNIACQWKKGLPERNAKMPRDIRLPLDKITYQCALPVWHTASHNEDCKENNSLSYKPGVSKRRGQRVDVLEDKIDSHNFHKNIGQGDALQRKLIVAIAERERQVTGFKEISATVEHDMKKEWKTMIEAWLADPSQPNPYTLSRKDCPTEAEVRLEVQRDEDAVLTEGRSPLQGSSATTFLTAGLQLEVAQRRILVEIAGTALVTADREGKLYDWQHTLLVKIGTFRDLQKRFMPGAARAIAEAEAARDPDEPPPKPEKIDLFMPSDMPEDPTDPLRGCMRGLLEMEAKLRAAQCSNTLVKLRAWLHAKRHLIIFRNDNVQATKAATLIGQLGERVNESAEKYWRGRRALISLRGEEACRVEFPELRPADVQLDGDAGESDAAARKKNVEATDVLDLDRPGRWMTRKNGCMNVSGCILSGAPDFDSYLAAVRVEWARARARKVRWEEEVLMLREEMQRVLRMLRWLGGWWRA
ncbi:hypothetical protein B0H11DRAFT_2244215 [Mycena galericulata]|nr:hypothetical protein B0H11DRAFT_2244215 [Mycena galericulata]